MNEFLNISVAKNGYCIDRMYQASEPPYMIVDKQVCKTDAELLKLIKETLKLIRK